MNATTTTDATETAPRVRKPVDPRTIPTEYSGWIQTYPRPDEPDHKGCSASVYGTTLPELMADVFRTATFYNANGYRVELHHLELGCRTCHSTGQVKAANGKRYKDCKMCHGQGVLQQFPDVEMKPSDNVEIKHK